MSRMWTEEGVRMMLRRKIEEAGGVRAFARKHKLSPAFISDVARGRRNMSERMQVILGIQVVMPDIKYTRIR